MTDMLENPLVGAYFTLEIEGKLQGHFLGSGAASARKLRLLSTNRPAKKGTKPLSRKYRGA